METTKDFDIHEGDVVVILPKRVIAQVRAWVEKDCDPIAGTMVLNELRRHLGELWYDPQVKDLRDEYFDVRPPIKWGDVAVYAGNRRITTRAANGGRLARKRTRRARLTTARVMRPVFQFGKYRVIADPNEFISVDHVPEKVFDLIREVCDGQAL